MCDFVGYSENTGSFWNSVFNNESNTIGFKMKKTIQQRQCEACKKIQDYKKARKDVEILKHKLAQAKPELIDWIELHFGRVK